ncbi:hypothetical protein BD410DRAFT_753187 [Rickenella mellea]|uniref:DUF6697 domain-containing protein n=1 Tax=Rickenella mellea TaxID=50990 RepID=A0A4Y7PTW5_9AGAM|nr:hypothetical protein BD410DRAFT_753187 [Rickenella mellea]
MSISSGISQEELKNIPIVYPGRPSDAFIHGPQAGTNENNHDLVEELRQARREIQLLKSMDPFRAADMALEIQVMKMHADEAASARDSAVQRLASAYDSIKQKAQLVTKLQSEKDELERKLADSTFRVQETVAAARADERRSMEAEIVRLTGVIAKLNAEIARLRGGKAVDGGLASIWDSGHPIVSSASLAPKASTDNALRNITNGIDHLAIEPSRPRSALSTSSATVVPISSTCSTPIMKPKLSGILTSSHIESNQRDVSPIRNPKHIIDARFAILASLPLPNTVPNDVLKPIIIPPPVTLHEFLSNATGSTKSYLTGYRAFQDKTTMWCPEREEHGYFMTPLYKCNTNPRIITAHRWTEVDPRGRLDQPTECFYNKDGKWYYAGQYVALRLEDLSVKEWETLEPETVSTLIKDTLSGRKNTSPQNHYETAQLYAVGALKVACVGLQCVGFNTALYDAIVAQAARCTVSGRWRAMWGEEMG